MFLTYNTPKKGTVSAMLMFRNNPRAAMGLMKRFLVLEPCLPAASGPDNVGFAGSM